ncbi:hypothetical protein OHS81_20985 [Streptomyces sp. NBC_00400]|uniref:hypothetical protein n=1 Tax=Streptomyces sp. NBC_00400 TaxID=2975737 RepID=UPI002E1A7DCD
MTHAKKALAVGTIAAAITIGMATATPAVADSHRPAAHYTTLDHHVPIVGPVDAKDRHRP